MAQIRLTGDILGSILDVGGGGEGVVGRLYGRRVTAIDNRQEELDEAPDCCDKRLMDGTALDFPDASFDNVTFFYSLMYMSRQEKARALAEAARVLRPAGQLYIWDAEFVSAWPEPFIVHLDIRADGFALSTDYGIAGEEMGQDADSVVALARKAGLRQVKRYAGNGQMFLLLRRG